ncbi:MULTISPECIES: class I SAM-dependent methyltransferase [Methanobacterium]|uniref:Methyltransferase type 11 n=1 Tax=Methanobacterium bryantii TaxID=2161 RepID=A0A2A2H7Q1_METBR|nr:MULTISPECIES: class I SAM-dependent methyltransferase [Methanobacterium]OEC85184.1 methyltransferase type 11 [Methanobacterium sp. A39]PAV05365.1 methyltransferase type 11 [Methanobacterium bryantii]
MAKFEPFEKHAQKYDEWFNKNKHFYESELQAIKELLPKSKNGIEIGVGSGRFAAPLGIKLGVDPSRKMGEIAQMRGIKFVEGIAESLPFEDSQFDFVLMVTTICFLDDVEAAFNEVSRVLKSGGSLIIGFIDAESPMGKLYEKHRNESTFYKDATFYSVKEVISYMKKAQFKDFSFRQTLFKSGEELKDIEPVKKGFGEGSFVVVRGVK